MENIQIRIRIQIETIATAKPKEHFFQKMSERVREFIEKQCS